MNQSSTVRHRGVRIERRGHRWRWELGSGRTRQRPSFECLDEAIRALDAALDERDRQRPDRRPRSTLTVYELLERWFLAKRPRLAPGTASSYELYIRVHVVPAIGSADANTIKPKDLDAFYQTLRWKAAKESHNVIRQAFAWGLRNGELIREGNPALVARPDRRACIDHDGTYDYADRIEPIDEKAVPTRPEVEKLLTDAAPRKPIHWWLYLLVATTLGARPGEICALRRRDIDFARKVVRIAWSADRVSKKLKRPKSPHSIRELPVSERFLRRIAPYLPDDPDAFLFPSNTYRGQRSKLPCWNPRSVKRRLDEACARLGIGPYTPHSFRHYVATHLLDQGASPVQVARFLGHADDSLVRKLYANHLVPETQRAIGEAASRLVDEIDPEIGDSQPGLRSPEEEPMQWV